MAWPRAFLGILLVGAIAIAGIALNFTLLRLTQDAHDPVGKLSPRAVFSGRTTPAAPPETTTTDATTTTPDHDGDGDSDD
jgi:hypothetical protein